MTLEQIIWRGVHVELPHLRSRVLVYMPLASVPVTVADYDAHHSWCELGGRMLEASRITHWADMPKGADPP